MRLQQEGRLVEKMPAALEGLRWMIELIESA